MRRLVSLIIISFFLMTLLCGCGLTRSSKNDLADYDGYLWNGGDSSKHLAKFQPELDEIPRDYLEYIKLNPDEYEIDTLEQWSGNNFGAQAAYHSYVYKKGENPDSGFYIWVLDDGRTIDTRFVENLNPAVQKYLADKINKDYPDFRVLASVFFHNMPSKEWSESDGIETLLSSDDDYRVYLHIVYGQDATVTESDVENIKNDLSYLNDVDAWFFRVDDPDSVERDELYKMDEEFWF